MYATMTNPTRVTADKGPTTAAVTTWDGQGNMVTVSFYSEDGSALSELVAWAANVVEQATSL